jgi:hypothetical protein
VKHLRISDAHLQPTHARGEHAEMPVFMLYPYHVSSSQAVRIFAAYAVRAGADPEHCRRIYEYADEMDAWAKEHGGTKLPDEELLPSTLPQAPVPQFCPHCAQPLAVGHAEDCPFLVYEAKLEARART